MSVVQVRIVRMLVHHRRVVVPVGVRFTLRIIRPVLVLMVRIPRTSACPGIAGSAAPPISPARKGNARAWCRLSPVSGSGFSNHGPGSGPDRSSILQQLLQQMRQGMLGVLTLVLTSCVNFSANPSDFRVSTDGSAPVRFLWMQTAADEDGATLHGSFLQKRRWGTVVPYPGHVDLQIIEANGRSYIRRIPRGLVPPGSRWSYERVAYFEAQLSPCIPKGSTVVVRYSVEEDHHLLTSSCTAALDLSLLRVLATW